jgi:hypothetical protein
MVENKEQTTIEYKDGLLITTMNYPKRDLDLQVGGNKYTVGWDGPNKIVQVVTKDNILILLDYLKEQFALINGRYEESKKQLADIGDMDEKLATALENHSNQLRLANSKDVQRLVKRLPGYAELVDKVLKRHNLKKSIADTEPSVQRLKEQIETILKIMKEHKL